MRLFAIFTLYTLGLAVFIGALVFGVDRELARRDYERYSTTQEELIVGCIFETNCKYYNDLLELEDEQND